VAAFFKIRKMEKQYLIKADSITGVHGRIMFKGEIVPESWLLNHGEHADASHIEEVVEVPEVVAAPIKPKKETPAKENV
jgi:hypothetical protein